MKNDRKYTVMGNDGKEYGPVSDGQVREWIKDGRLERKSPVKPNDAKDWLFLEMVPEFNETLAAMDRPKSAGWRSKIWLVIFFGLVLAGVVILALKQLKHL